MYLKVETSDDANKLSELLKNGDWMVLYYAEWCGHCKVMKPEWEKVVEKLKDSGKINIADIKSDLIGALSHKPTIEGFPTIKMYNKGNEVANFKDERSAEKLEKFAISNANTKANTKANTNTNNKTAIKMAIKTALQKLSKKDTVNTLDLEELPTAQSPLLESSPEPSPLPVVMGYNSNEVKKLSLSQLKDEIIKSHTKSNNNAIPSNVIPSNVIANNVIEIKNANDIHANKNRVSKKQDTNIGNLEMLLQPPAPSIKASKKPTFMKKKTQKNLILKGNANPAVPLAIPLVCSDIRKAKFCKTNPKCFFDYIEFKCKDKSERPAQTLNIINAAKGSKRSKVQGLPKGLPKRLLRSKKNNKNNQTKAILQELQKSFKKISNEARKDSNLIAKASERI